MSTETRVIDKDKNIQDALRLMNKNRISRLIVVDSKKDKTVIGMLTETDIAKKLGSSKYGNLSPAHFHISTVMTKKLITIDSESTLGEASEIMLENNISSLPIMDDGLLTGIVTKTDFVEICQGKAYEKEIVGQNMTTDLLTIDITDRLIHARRIMLDAKVRRIFITENEEIVGVITAKDIAKTMADFRKNTPEKHQATQIRQLGVEEVMSTNLISVYEDDSIPEASKLLLDKKLSGLPVRNKADAIIGLLTKTDLLELVNSLEN